MSKTLPPQMFAADEPEMDVTLPEAGGSWDEYCQIDAMNGSTLVYGLKSMRQLKHAIDSQFTPTPTMQLGTAAHALLLEPEEFERRFVVVPNFHLDDANRTKPKRKGELGDPTNSKATSYVKQKVSEFARENTGREFLQREQYDAALAMIEAIRDNATASMWLHDDSTRFEVTVIGELEGMACKGRLDVLNRYSIIDVKTASDCHPVKFGRFAANNGYLFKQAIHRELVRQMTGLTLPVRYIVVENTPPYDCCVMEFTREDEAIFDHELEKARRVIRDYQKCLESGVFPGVDGGADYVNFYVPDWMMPDEHIEGWG